MSDEASAAPSAKRSCAFEPLTAGHLFFLLHHLVRQRELALGQELAASGLTLGPWQVLATLSRLGTATMGEVAAFCAADRTTLTRTVDRMVTDGLLSRERDAGDRRQVNLKLTDKGEAAYEAALVQVTRFNDRVTAVLEPEEMERVQPMIRRVLVRVMDDKAWVDDLMAFRRLTAPEPAS